MHLRLSDNSIKELDPSPAKPQYEIRDNRIGGFSIIIGRFGNITTRRARIIAQQDLISISQGIIPPHRDRFGTPRSTPYQIPVNNNEAANKEITLKHAWEKYKVNHMERKNRSHKTIQGYQNYIYNNISDWLDRPLSSFASSTDDIVEPYNHMVKNNGIATANNVMRIFRTVYRYAADKLDRSPPDKHPVTAIDFYQLERRNTAMGPEDLAKWNKQRKALDNPIR